jgi:threonine dehydrogenase-like Zn-dependent dehydrogenase
MARKEMKTIYIELDVWRVLTTKALGKLWRGATFGPLSPLHYAEVPRPPLPGPRWVRVKTRLAGICGSDLHLVFIEGSLSVAPAALPGHARMYMGHEAVGDVIEVGPGVSRFQVGERVVIHGGNDCLSMGVEPPCRHCAVGNRALCENSSELSGPHAVGGGWGEEFVRHENSLFPVPEGLSDEEAVLIEPASNGVRAALRGDPQPGDRVLIIGAGTLGLMTLQALRAAQPDVDVTISVLFPYQAEEALKRGADRTLIGEDLYQATAQLTGAKLYQGSFPSISLRPLRTSGNRMLLGGFDLIYDCVGAEATLGTALRCARAGGRVVLVGVKLSPMKLDLTPVWHQEVDLRGFYAHGVEEWEGERLSSYERGVKWVQEGRMNLRGMVTHRFPLAAYSQALALASAWDKQRYRSIKVAFEFK